MKRYAKLYNQDVNWSRQLERLAMASIVIAFAMGIDVKPNGELPLLSGISEALCGVKERHLTELRTPHKLGH